MKTVTWFSALCLVAANARMFRGGLLQKSSDFQGDDHAGHIAKGTVFHRDSADVPTETSTITHVTEDIKLMLARKLPGLIANTKAIMAEQADTGILFCGAESGDSHLGVTEISFYGADMAAAGHDYQDSPVAKDGFIAGLAVLGGDTDVRQCGASRCLPESMVAKIAGLIRSHGYHIKHSDICEARGGGLWSVPTCALDASGNGAGPEYQRAYSCPRENGVAMQWEYDRQCANGGGVNGQCMPLVAEGTNIARPDFLESKGCTWNWVNDIGMNPEYYSTGECPRGVATGYAGQCSKWGICGVYPGCGQGCSSGTRLSGWPQTGPTNAQLGFTKHATGEFCTSFVHPVVGGGPAVNQVARVIKYGQVVGKAVDMPDSVVVTGDGGCMSLRGIVLALNGNKLTGKYVDKQHAFAAEYWQTQIDETRSIVKTIREKIINLQGLGGYFYPLETSKAFECGSEFGAFEQGIDAGGPDDPKCDLAGTDYSSFQGTPHHKSMAQRSTCFCRSFADSGDDFYLTTTQSTGKAFCDANFKEKLPSVYTYCLAHAQLGDTEEWQKSVSQLLFSPEDVPTQLDTWFPGAVDELRTAFENSIQGQGTKCGRVSSADPNTVKFSNKGGNCVPLEGVQDIVYRLEFEFFNAAAAVDRKGAGNAYADTMCVANPGGEQVLSFRQLAYDWQRLHTSGPNNGKYHAEEDVNTDTIQTTDAKAQFYDDDGNNNYEDFCAIDYSQLLGGGKAYTEAGVKVADPLNYLGRVNGEAGWNADKSLAEKTKTEREREVLWKYFTKTMTDSDTGNPELVHFIGEKAANHFMAVLGHDATANRFSPICSKRVRVNALSVDSNLQNCDQVQILEIENAGDIEVGTFGAYNTEKLQQTILKSGTRKYDVKSMAFRNTIKSNGHHTLLFEGDRYEASAASGLSINFAPNSVDATARCGLSCAEGYYDNATDWTDYLPPLCNTADTSELESRFCELDHAKYVKDFMTLQVVQDTTIDCTDKPTMNGKVPLRVLDLYQGSNCGKLTIGDLTNCPSLTHVYIHTNEDYVTTGPNTAGACAAAVDMSSAKFPDSVRLIWSNKASVVDDAISKVDNFDHIAFGVDNVLKDGLEVSNTAELCIGESVKNITNVATLQNQNFASFDASSFADKSPAPVASATGDQTYVVGGAATMGRFGEECSFAQTLILPDSIDHIADSAVLDLNLQLTGNKLFYLVVGEKLFKNGNRPEFNRVALFVDDNSDAQLFRRCPTMTLDRDDGTRSSLTEAQREYGISAEIVGETNSGGLVEKPANVGRFADVIWGTGIVELMGNNEVFERSVNLNDAYDGVTASRGGGQGQDGSGNIVGNAGFGGCFSKPDVHARVNVVGLRPPA